MKTVFILDEEDNHAKWLISKAPDFRDALEELAAIFSHWEEDKKYDSDQAMEDVGDVLWRSGIKMT